MTPPLVIVTWHDANASATEVYQKAKHHIPAILTTVGWLVDDDELGVSLCCERNTDEADMWHRGHTFIPRGMVVKIERLS